MTSCEKRELTDDCNAVFITGMFPLVDTTAAAAAGVTFNNISVL